MATAAVLFFVWRFWQDDEPLRVTRRTLKDFQLEWKCEAGHYARAYGQADPRPCPRCGRPSYPVGTYVCPVHGEFEVAVRYKVKPNGVEEPWRFRVERGPWGPAASTLICPKCERTLRRKRENPFESTAPRRKRRKKTQD